MDTKEDRICLFIGGVLFGVIWSSVFWLGYYLIYLKPNTGE